MVNEANDLGEIINGNFNAIADLIEANETIEKLEELDAIKQRTSNLIDEWRDIEDQIDFDFMSDLETRF